MISLAIDASERSVSVCLKRDAGSAVLLEAIERIEQLPARLQSLLQAEGLRPQDLDRLGVISGPGSYTGLRGSLLLAQTLARITGLPVMARSRPEVLLYAGRERGIPLLAVQSVRQQQYYCLLGQYADQTGLSLQQPGMLVDEQGLYCIQSTANAPVIGDWPELNGQTNATGQIQGNQTIERLKSAHIATSLAEWTQNDFTSSPPDSLVPFYIRPAVQPTGNA